MKRLDNSDSGRRTPTLSGGLGRSLVTVSSIRVKYSHTVTALSVELRGSPDGSQTALFRKVAGVVHEEDRDTTLLDVEDPY